MRILLKTIFLNVHYTLYNIFFWIENFFIFTLFYLPVQFIGKTGTFVEVMKPIKFLSRKFLKDTHSEWDDVIYFPVIRWKVKVKF